MRYIVIFLFPLILFANDISFNLSYYEDKDSSTFEEIKHKQYIPIKAQYLNQGFTNNTIWVKIDIKNNTKQNIQKILYLDNSTITFINLYTQNKSLKTNNIKDLYYNFNININKNSSNTYYLKIQSKHTLSTQFYLEDRQKYFSDINYKKFFLTFFFGFIVSIIIYNIFLFFILKEIVYLYYITFQTVTLILFLSFSGIGTYMLWIDNHIVNSFILKVFDDLGIILGLLFIQKFLNIKKYSLILNYLIYITVILLSIVIILPMPFIYLKKVIMISGLLLVFITAIYGVVKKIPIAKLFLFGWLILILGSILTLLKNFGHIEGSILINWSMYIGSMIEAVVFSIALAKQIETLKNEKKQILLDVQNNLHKQIKSKTKKLTNSLEQQQILFKEVRHRTKNNLQIISSFVTFLSLKEKDERVKLNYLSLNDRIQTISLVNQLLFKQKNLHIINTQEYIHTLVKNLSYLIYKDTKIEYKIDICNKNLSINKITILGLIINELVTNSLKYAFDPKNIGLITINLINNDDDFILTFKDDGIGFDFETQKNSSIGLKLIHRLATKQLQSKINFTSKNGSCFTFKFSGLEDE